MQGDAEASVPVLEAIIVASIMLSAVAFVATFERPPSGDESARAALSQRARDAMGILLDTPVQGSSLGDDLLSVYVAECLQGNCSRMTGKLDRLLPAGASYAVYVSNGRGLYPLYEPAKPIGEAVTARQVMEPRWSSTFLSPAMPLVNPAGDPLVLNALPIYNSNVLTTDGTPVLVTIEATRLTDGARYSLQAATTTRASATGDAAPQPAVSTYFVDNAGSLLVALDGRGTTLDGAKLPTGALLRVTARVHETGGGDVPAGARLTVTLPPGWTGSAPNALNSAQWTLVSNATDVNGSAIVATLNAPLSSGYADLKMDLVYEGDANDHYPIRARLSNGAAATGQLLVRADEKTSATFEVPAVLVGAPRPLGTSGATVWTLSAQVPAAITGLPAESILVQRVTVRADSGEPLFTSVAGLANASGAWTLSSGEASWSGAALLTHDAPLALAFAATGASVARPVSDRAAFTPSVKLDAQDAELHDETSPGLRRIALPPNSQRAGYNGTIGAGLVANHSAQQAAPYRGTALPGEAPYRVGYFAPTQDALDGSVIRVGSRTVAVGGSTSVFVNLQPAMYLLAELGFAPAVDVNVYPPWSGDARDPILQTRLYTAELGGNGTYLAQVDSNNDGTPDSPTAGIYNFTLDVPDHWLFGPYIVEANVTWNEEVTKVIDGSAVTQQFVRNARIYDYFVATPPDALMPPVPMYDVHLVAWFDDWR